MLAIGDLHLDKLKNLFPTNHLDIQFYELEKSIQYARKQGESHVVFLGDLCENIRLSQEAECKLIRFLLDLDKKMNVHIILGNHDFAENGNHSLLPFIELQRCKVFKNTKFYDTPTQENIDGVIHNFVPYPHKEGIKNAINYGHFEVSGSTRDNGTTIKKAIDVSKKENWIMGHLHTPHDVGNVHYTGTLYQLNFGESLPKSFSIINAFTKKGKTKLDVERVRTAPAFRLITLEVYKEKDLKKIEKNPLYKYRLLADANFSTDIDIMDKHPNVVKIEGFKTKKELEALKQDSFIELTEQNLELPSVTAELEKFLREEKKATDKQIKRAFGIIRELKQK